MSRSNHVVPSLFLIPVFAVAGFNEAISISFAQQTIPQPLPAAAGASTSGPTLGSLKSEIADLQNRLQSIDAEISRLSLWEPPVGTIVGFLGPIPADEAQRSAWERKAGWLLCDGRSLASKPEYAQLRQVLGGDTLPDLRSMFVRGLDLPRDGQLANKDEDKDRKAGSFQNFSTARPQPRDGKDTKLVTNEEKEQDLTSTGDAGFPPPQENVRFNMLMAKRGNGYGTLTGEATDATVGEPTLFAAGPIKNVPAHSHTIDSGGNIESRPVNIGVYWLIKATSSSFPQH